MPSSPVYTRLEQSQKQIRVLIIQPGQPEQPVRCAFDFISLKGIPIPPYETVSYAWGKAVFSEEIYVNDQVFKVAINAKNVLVAMRYPDRQRIVWIDAICIDQGDLEDRNYCVQLMCEIYSNTCAGFVWLGEDDINAKQTFRALEEMYDEARLQTKDFATFKETVWPQWWNVHRPPTSVKYNPEAMARMFEKSWFARLWVVQEAALAPDSICHCGSSSIPLTHLLRAAVWLYSQSKALPQPMVRTTLHGLARAVHVASYADSIFEVPFQAETNLLWMMNTLRQYDVSMDQDHVYRLLGMYQRFKPGLDALPAGIAPDYSRAVRDIYCDAAKLAMAELNSADTLLYVCHRTTEEVKTNWLPTWIPQWQRKQDLEVDYFPLNHKGFHAGGPSCTVGSNVFMEGRLDVLSLEGFILDEIHSVAPVFVASMLENAEGLLVWVKHIEDLVPGSDLDNGDLALTLIASLSHARALMTQKQAQAGYAAIKHFMVEHGHLPRIKDNYQKPNASIAHAYLEALSRWSKNRCFFITCKGYIGIGPKVVRSDDVVVILQGCSVPLVLRHYLRSEASYFVVGQAYVNGVMFGEGVVAHRARGRCDDIMHLV
ncbi:hypothetical protein LTR78_007774 [Recurvomyces mirabilis]|uniref:Heterokaryon incompatibility domain-containing protein n=1 Tax=Recurvomyces mirabilis TaxID=574656 RepID=A0AAE0WJ92_9PEZI|nr:hypothetical protein LTR78_007774 [Recurvomyces mirabilis]KAK5151662.1 hypothetical protein LTS14_009149 [Recurvomyces mirabilis]